MSYSSPTKSHSALLRLTWRNLNNSNLLLIEADKLQTRNIFENIFFRCYVFAQNLQKLKRFCVILVVMNPYTKKQDIWGIFYLPAFLYLWKVGWDPTILSVRHFRESLILTAIYYHSFISFFLSFIFHRKKHLTLTLLHIKVQNGVFRAQNLRFILIHLLDTIYFPK